MHPTILLTVLIFLPGIRSSIEVKHAALSPKWDHTKGDVILKDASPIEEPFTFDNVNDIKPYQWKLMKKYGKYDDNLRKSKHDFLSSKNIDSSKRFDDNKYGWESDEIVSWSREDKIKSGMMGAINDKKMDSEMKSHKVSHDKTRMHKKYKGLEKFEDKTDSLKEKRKNPYKKDLAELKGSIDYPKFYFRKGFHDVKSKDSSYFPKDRRAKRQTDSDSEEEDYSAEEDGIGDENKSDVSLGSAEKQLMAHFMGGDAEDDWPPFKDVIEVEIKEKHDASGEIVPVVEEEISKKTAYVSCGIEDGSACGRPNQNYNRHSFRIVKTQSKTSEEDAPSD